MVSKSLGLDFNENVNEFNKTQKGLQLILPSSAGWLSWAAASPVLDAGRSLIAVERRSLRITRSLVALNALVGGIMASWLTCSEGIAQLEPMENIEAYLGSSRREFSKILEPLSRVVFNSTTFCARRSWNLLSFCFEVDMWTVFYREFAAVVSTD